MRTGAGHPRATVRHGLYHVIEETIQQIYNKKVYAMNANATINRKSIDISADAKDRLESAVKYVKKQYPGMGIKAEYRDFKDLKVKWIETYKWIEFEVSDYLSETPAEVLGPFMKTLMAQIFDEQPNSLASNKALFPYVAPFKDAFIARHEAVRDEAATEAVRSVLKDTGYDNTGVIGAVGMNPNISVAFDIIILAPDWSEEGVEDMVAKYIDLKKRFEE